MPDLELALEEKQEIDSIVGKLRENYHLPSQGCDLRDLFAISRGRNVQVSYCEDAITAYAVVQEYPKRSYVILPPLIEGEEIFTAEYLAHELGHIILNTLSETKVEHFTTVLTGRSPFVEDSKELSDYLDKKWRLAIERYTKNSSCAEESWRLLRMNNIPESAVQDIIIDYKEGEEKIKSHLATQKSMSK